jgi:hypothetical protein
MRSATPHKDASHAMYKRAHTPAGQQPRGDPGQQNARPRRCTTEAMHDDQEQSRGAAGTHEALCFCRPSSRPCKSSLATSAACARFSSWVKAYVLGTAARACTPNSRKSHQIGSHDPAGSTAAGCHGEASWRRGDVLDKREQT